jgi:RecB family exonuclease
LAGQNPTPKAASAPAPPLLPRRISPAAISRYRVCPKAVFFQYVAKVPKRERPSPTLMVGNAVHAALKLFFGIRPEDRSEPVLHQCLRRVWQEHKHPDTFMTREEEHDYGMQALRLLSDFYSSFDVGALPLARERWVSTRLNNGVELYGKVDRVDGEVHRNRKGSLTVIDYKTGRFQLDDSDLKDEPAAQAYALATEDEYAREVERVRYLYLASGEEARWEPEREDIEAAREELLAVTWEMFTDQEFEARPGEHCARCPFNHVCPDAGRVELTDLEVDDDLAF